MVYSDPERDRPELLNHSHYVPTEIHELAKAVRSSNPQTSSLERLVPGVLHKVQDMQRNAERNAYEYKGEGKNTK